MNFSCRNARSPSLLAGLSLAISVETAVAHLWLVSGYPIAAWTLSAVSAISLLWLIGDYRALGRGSVLVDNGALRIRVGWRATADIPLHALLAAMRPAWRDIPEAGQDQGYINLMQPADPNVLLTFTNSVSIRLMGMANKPATRVGLTLDAPDDFVDAVQGALRAVPPT